MITEKIQIKQKFDPDIKEARKKNKVDTDYGKVCI